MQKASLFHIPSYASVCERIRAYANAYFRNANVCYNDNINVNDNEYVNEYDNEQIFHMWKTQRLNNLPHMLTSVMFDSRIEVEEKHILR